MDNTPEDPVRHILSTAVNGSTKRKILLIASTEGQRTGALIRNILTNYLDSHDGRARLANAKKGLKTL